MKAIEKCDFDKIGGGLFAGDAGNAVVYQINGGDIAGCTAAAAAAIGAAGRNVAADIAVVGACWNVVGAASALQPAQPNSPPNGSSQINAVDRR